MSSRHPRRSPGDQRSTGFTLVELAVTALLLAVLGGILATCIGDMRQATLTGSIESKLQEAGHHALREILADVHRSGQLVVDSKSYPFLFEDGEAGGAFAIHAHAKAVQHAQDGEPGFGPNREIVLLRPQDLDTRGPPLVEGTPDGIPDLDEDGLLVWDASEVSYVLTTEADGINRLERRIDGVADRVVALNVDRIVFDDVSSDLTLPLDCVRVRIFFRQQDSQRRIHRYQAQALMRMRNGI